MAKTITTAWQVHCTGCNHASFELRDTERRTPRPEVVERSCSPCPECGCRRLHADMLWRRDSLVAA